MGEEIGQGKARQHAGGLGFFTKSDTGDVWGKRNRKGKGIKGCFPGMAGEENAQANRRALMIETATFQPTEEERDDCNPLPVFSKGTSEARGSNSLEDERPEQECTGVEPTTHNTVERE